jgi:hypothetical protein
LISYGIFSLLLLPFKFLDFLTSKKRDRIKSIVMRSVKSYEMMKKDPGELQGDPVSRTAPTTSTEPGEKAASKRPVAPTWDYIAAAEDALLSEDANFVNKCPAWLLDRVRKSRCALPRFVNMLMFKVVFLTPVVESGALESSYVPCFPLIQLYADALFSTVGTDGERKVEEGETPVEVSIYGRRQVKGRTKGCMGRFRIEVQRRDELVLVPEDDR